MRLLLVDDETEFLEMMGKRLVHRGIDTSVADSGRKALDILDNKEIDAVVLDVKMPGMDGLQVLQEIKRRKPGMVVVLLTGHADLDTAVQGMDSGAFDYLMKPVALEELLAKLHEAMDERQPLDSSA
ncbi:MAG: response regulator [Desulfovibrionaceae bacterium]